MARRCGMGVLLLVGFAQPQSEYPFLPLTQNLLHHHTGLAIDTLTTRRSNL
jgi:hypothetical protein